MELTPINQKESYVPTNGYEIREAFLNFFAAREHLVIKSASLVPEDPTVMLTIAGMLPFKPVFLGIKKRPALRATSSQKCIRTNDIENVGLTARHHTFFEMLGNFSFGDYFKKEAIQWSWELITDVFKLNPNNIVVSVFEKDDESVEIWRDQIGVNPERIIRMGEKDNFWSSGATGPCGPCSELYYDFHPEQGSEEINLEDDSRFIEFYNLVFMQYNRSSDGSISELESRNIDTGMGLERMAQILQKKANNYETDLIFPLIERAANIANIDYFSTDKKNQISLKILGDHSRAVVHLISDGVKSSNLGRGYILRRLIRRMIRHGRLIGINKSFLPVLAKLAINLMEQAYPDLAKNSDQIIREIETEESRFLYTLERGEKLLSELIASKSKFISGEKAFELYDTFGFPLELTQEIAYEHGIDVDLQGFEDQMLKQQARAKAASTNIDLTLQGSLEREIDSFSKTEFIGYSTLESSAQIKGIFLDSHLAEKAIKGDKVQVVLDKTSFYGESGGQIGDQGLIYSDNLELHIDNVIRKKNIFLHCGIIKKGSIALNQVVETRVNKRERLKAQANHTATHLLQSALKLVVDQGVGQRGSLVAFNKLRFDFNSSSAISKVEISQIELLVNKWIIENHPILIKNMPISDALEAGALAMFGEKYGEIVRVVDVPGVSMELCGGTHVTSTIELGFFKIINEIGISAGIRRIEAVAGPAVLEYFTTRDDVVNQLSALLKVQPNQIVDRVLNLQADNQDKSKLLNKANEEIVVSKALSIASLSEIINGTKIIIKTIHGIEGSALQKLALTIIDELGDQSAVILGGNPDSSNKKKLLFVVAFGSALLDKGLNAGVFINNVARICSGGGGGKPNLASAGAKDSAKLPDALEFAKKELINLIR
tara:strand:+ start:4251 stop:6914 length:2664 start_codon:yes stop_codon:yes gene_type:complete